MAHLYQAKEILVITKVFRVSINYTTNFKT